MTATVPERLYTLRLCDWGTVLRPDGVARSWIALNRDHRPFRTGISRSIWVDFNTCEGLRLWLSERQICQISNGSRQYRYGDIHCWLYSDATSPNTNKANLVDYLQRLAMLEALTERGA